MGSFYCVRRCNAKSGPFHDETINTGFHKKKYLCVRSVAKKEADEAGKFCAIETVSAEPEDLLAQGNGTELR
jgi:hypothetical protein